MKLQLILAILLYVLLYFLRLHQGPWEIKTDVFSSQLQFLDHRISQFLPSPQAELLSGILLGQNKNLPGQLKLALRDTSTLHIVVASGQNLSIVAGFFLYLSGLIKRRNAVVLGLLAAAGYTLLTGLQVPILRAALMFSASSAAVLLGRGKDSWWILIVTAGLMLLINPTWITNLSFQLSFLATLGVIVVSPILLKWLANIPILSGDLAVTLAAQIMVTPVIAANFHQLSLVSLITNVLVLWVISFIMIGGSAMLLVGLIWQTGGQILALGVNAMLTYFIYIVQFFAHLPFAWEYVGEFSWLVWAGYYAIVASVLIFLTAQFDNS